MAFNNLNFDLIKSDAESFTISAKDSYLQSYPEFVKYFHDIEPITIHHLIIGSHFVYGWMPTTLNLDLSNAERVLQILNDVKVGKLLEIEDITIIKACVNNSMVGASKLLHFINPKLYAIWDSRIFRYMSGKKSQYRIDKPENFLEYLKALRKIIRRNDYHIIQRKIETHCGYPITDLRVIDIVMFETDRNRKRESAN